jgi:hypothetical protein
LFLFGNEELISGDGGSNLFDEGLEAQPRYLGRKAIEVSNF